MTCNEINCKSSSCALCYDCKQSLCLNHIILHHDQLIQRHLLFYEILQQLYDKLHSMNVEQCYNEAVEQILSNESYSFDFIRQVRSIREELIEQLNRFKENQFHQLKEISLRVNDTKRLLFEDEESDLRNKLENIRLSINSLVYGIHLEMYKTTKTIQCRKIFYHKNDPSIENQNGFSSEKSLSWSNGLTENYWKKKT